MDKIILNGRREKEMRQSQAKSKRLFSTREVRPEGRPNSLPFDLELDNLKRTCSRIIPDKIRLKLQGRGVCWARFSLICGWLHKCWGTPLEDGEWVMALSYSTICSPSLSLLLIYLLEGLGKNTQNCYGNITLIKDIFTPFI